MTKKRFVFYNDRIDYLGEMGVEEKAEFLETILKYQNGQDVKPITGFKFVRPRIKSMMDEDQEKYEKVCQRNRENGKTGGRPRQTQTNPLGYLETQTNPNKPDNDNDNDNEKDNKKNFSKEKDKSEIIETGLDFFGNKKELVEKEKSSVQKEKDFGDPNVNEILEIIKSYNNGIMDGSQKEQRQYGKLLFDKLQKIENGSYKRQDLIRIILEIAGKNSFHCHKISGPKKIYYELGSLMQLCKAEIQKSKKNRIEEF